MKNVLLPYRAGVIIALAFFVALATDSARVRADTVTYDSALAAPGFYNGTGGVNNGFTIDTNNGIEVGLRSSLRQNPADEATAGSNVYNMPLGLQTNVTSGGNGANTSRGAWGVEYSLNLQPGNTSAISNGLTLSDITALLTVTGGPGSPVSVNPVTFFSDNAGYGPAGKNVALSNLPTDWGFQNSENELFFGFDPNLNQTYTFSLQIFDLAGDQLAADNIVVNAGTGTPVPLPKPLVATGGLLLLLGGVTRGRKRSGSLYTAAA